MFKHSFLEVNELPSTTIDGKRIYHSPIGDLKSVTTILSERLDHRWVDEWKQKIGEEEANKIVENSRSRGNTLHNRLERYLMNESDWNKGMMPDAKFALKSVLPILDAKVELIYGIELPLWSRYLKTAGRADVVCKYNGSNAILDFKNARSKKTIEDLIQRGYLFQTTAYSIMLEEQYEIRAKKLVIIVMPEFEKAEVFELDRTEFIEQTINIFSGGKIK